MTLTMPQPVFDQAADAIRVAIAHRIAADLAGYSTQKGARAKLAELKVRQQRRGEIEAKIRTLNAQLDAAVRDHQQATAPAQARLKQIERDLADAIVSGGPADVLGNQRRAALDEVEAANLALERKTRELNEHLAVLQRELDAPELAVFPMDTVRGKIFELAPVELLARHRALGQTQQEAHERAKKAHERIAHYEKLLANNGRRKKTDPKMLGEWDIAEEKSVIQRRLAFAKAEAQECGRVSSEAAQMARAIYDDVMGGE
jgi:hypothetical protein